MTFRGPAVWGQGCFWTIPATPLLASTELKEHLTSYLWARTARRSTVCGSTAVRRAATKKKKREDFPRHSSWRELAPSISIKGAFVSLTSAWLPGARVLLHLSQRRQGRCQFFPRDDTFSAAHTHIHTHTNTPPWTQSPWRPAALVT